MPEQLNTVGVIAAKLGVPVHRVEYILRARTIEPVSRAGGLRIFTPEQAEQIADDLRHVDDREEGKA